MSMNGHPHNTLRQLTTLISSGSTPLGGQSVYLDDGPVMLVRSQNVQMNRLDVSDVAYISNEIDSQMQRSVVRHNDVLLNITGASIGRVARFNLKDTRANVNQHVCIIRPKPDQLSSRYLEYFLSSPVVQNDINNRYQHGGTRQALTFAQISEFEIPLPPLSEQKRIADILDKADAIRRKRQDAVAIVENKLLKSTFREQLGDPRTNPRRWPVEKLGDVINFVGGSQPPKETFINEPRSGYVRLVQIRDFKTDKYPTYIPKELARRPFGKDDVMIARYGPPVFQILRGLEGSYNVALMKAEKTERTTKDFIYYLLQIPEIHDVVVANSQRTAGQSGTNLTLLKGLEMPIPPIDKQIEITAILKSIETYHTTAKSYSESADDLFNALVQRAFRGEL